MVAEGGSRSRRSHVVEEDEGGVGPVVRMQLTHVASIDPARVPDVLGSGEAHWLGEALPESRPGARRYLCDLELHAGGDGRTLFRKAAVVTFGEPVARKRDWVVPIEWRAASLSPLFPVFVGELVIEADRLRLDGRYAPPGGRMGYLLDVALLGVAAKQTGQWFMRRVADALA